MDYQMEEEVHLHQGFQPWQWQWRLFSLLSSPALLSPATARRQPNHVTWEETAAAHLFSASLPGRRRSGEVENARYLVIRTELDADDVDAREDGVGRTRRSFARKFRLPGMVHADGISAEYAHGVLTVTVPRMHTRFRPAAAAVGLLGPGGPAQDSAAPAA